MSYTVSINIEGKLLRCHVTGQRQVNRSMELWKKLLYECQSNNLRYLILELALEGQITALEMLDSVHLLVDRIKKACPDLVIALVDQNEQSFTQNYLVGLIGKEEDLQGAVFQNAQKAEKWMAQRIAEDVL